MQLQIVNNLNYQQRIKFHVYFYIVSPKSYDIVLKIKFLNKFFFNLNYWKIAKQLRPDISYAEKIILAAVKRSIL